MLKKRPPGCCRANRDRGGLNKTQGLRLERERLYRYRDILGVCSSCALSKDCLSDLKCRHTGTNVFYHSRHLDARSIGKRHRHEIFHQALTDFPVERVHASRVDTQKHFARLWLWTWLLFKLELFRSTIAMDVNHSHCLCCHCCSHPLFSWCSRSFQGSRTPTETISGLTSRPQGHSQPRQESPPGDNGALAR